MKWVLVGVTILVVIMAAIVTTVLLVDRTRDNARRAAAAAAASATGVTSPYDLAELPADTDLDVVADAAFISIFVPDESGKLTSYGISSDLPAGQALIQAVKDADGVPQPSVAATTTTGTTGGDPADESTVTFVFATRDTLTFALDLEAGLIARAGQVWQPDGDLKALVQAAIGGPQ